MQLIHRITLVLLLIVYITIQALLFCDSSQHHFEKEDSVAEINSVLSEDLVEQEPSRFYAAIIDAGSTGTRLHLFEFNRKDWLQFDVEKENFKEVKPGLSSFSAYPDGAADSVQELLDAARAIVPESFVNRTPIVLKATAGLRLLPGSQADEIMKRVKERVVMSGFLMDENSVSILSGKDEGVFSWFTLNLLLDRMKYNAQEKRECEITKRAAKKPTNSTTAAAALDLGGGSTQITFMPKNRDIVFSVFDEQKFSHTVNVFGKTVQLFTHSYLGNGLIAARLGLTKKLGRIKNGFYLSACFPAEYLLESSDYSGNRWKIRGSAPSFNGCVNSAKQYVKEMGVKAVEELNDHEIFAFSYFYDRGLQAGLVPRTEDNRGGYVTVGDFKEAARQACSRPSVELGPEHWKPWQCLDLSYIYSLLHDGYGLRSTKKIYLAKRFRNMEMSWALGAGYDVLHTYHQSLSSSLSVDDYSNKSLKATEEQGFDKFAVDCLRFIADGAFSVLNFLNLVS